MKQDKQAILITGGAGYIGSHTIIDIFETTPFDVISVDNYSNSSPSVYERIEEITGKKVTIYNVDINDLQKTSAIFSTHKNIVGVIHFAAFKSVNESVANPVLYYKNNLNTLLNILECCKKYDVKNIIFSSSCTVYGNIDALPVTEDTKLQKPESPYGATKIIGEEILENFINSSDSYKAISLRYFNPVGAHISGKIGEDPRNKPNNLVPIITQFASGIIPEMFVYGNDYQTRDGSCIRDYIHVSDIADAHVKALSYLIGLNKKIYEVFNLGSGKGSSVFEIINSFERVSGEKLNYKVGPRRAGDVVAIYSNCEKAGNILNWKPQYSIDDMMRTAWKWQQHINKERMVQS